MNSLFASSVAFPSSLLAIIALGEGADAKMIACLFHSRRQVRDTIRAGMKAIALEEMPADVLRDMERVSLPEESPEAMILIGGTAPQTMHGLIGFMAAFLETGGSPTTSRMNILPRMCTFLTSKSPVVPDGMIGYADATKAFHFWIFFSKREGTRILRSIGGSATERKRAEAIIDQCGLPAAAGDSIHLTGEIARHLCLAGELRKQADHDAN